MGSACDLRGFRGHSKIDLGVGVSEMLPRGTGAHKLLRLVD